MRRPLTLGLRLVITFCICCSFRAASGQNCSCALTVDMQKYPASSVTINGLTALNGQSLQPGDTICLKGTRNGNILFKNIRGASGNPIIITNCDGKFLLNAQGRNAIRFDSSYHFRLTGGNIRNEYGIEIVGAIENGVLCEVRSTKFELDHLNVHHQGFAGIMAKTEPTCNNQTSWRGGTFTMEDISIHDNYIHHTVGEGMYIGATNMVTDGKKLDCDGDTTNGKETTAWPHDIHRAKIYNNRVEYTDSDGIQLGACTEGCMVYENSIIAYGQNPLHGALQHANGIQLGDGTGGLCFNNYVKNIPPPGKQTSWAIICVGRGDNVIYNNILLNASIGGIFLDERVPTTDITKKFFIINNTIAKCSIAIKTNAAEMLENVIKNNILHVKSGTKYILQGAGAVELDESNNIKVNTDTSLSALFADTINYKLKSGSYAINAGMNASTYGVTIDFDSIPRPQQSTYDIGAYEYPNPPGPPVADAGSDKIVTLPANSTTLNGSGSDQGGSIVSYSWSQVPGGPNQATIQSPNSMSTSVTGLIQGIYHFKLIVTDNDSYTDSDTVKVTVNSAPSDFKLFINAGGDTYVDGAKTWERDLQAQPHSTLNTSDPTYVTGSTAAFSGTNTTGVPNAILGTYRYTLDAGTTIRYNVPVPIAGAQYKITMYFAKKNADTFGSGARRFDILAEGSTIVPAYDVFDNTTNGADSVQRIVKVYDGVLNLSFISTYPAHAQVNDIAIEKTTTLPVSNAGSDVSIKLPINNATLSGSGYDGDGPVTYAWTQLSGPNQATIQSPSSPNTKVSGLVQGTYTFRLSVTDSDNNTATDNANVTVHAAGSSWSLFINAGGNTYTSGGITWQKDTQAEPHATLNTSYPSYVTGSTAAFSGVNNTGIPREVLGTYRYTLNTATTIKYDIPVPVSGTKYRIKFYFAMKNSDTFGSNVRRFDILAENNLVRNDYDVYDRTRDEADSVIYTVTVNDGVLNLAFIAPSGKYAQINDIFVEKIADPAPDQIALTINCGGDNFNNAGTIWQKDMQASPHAYLDQTNPSYSTGGAYSFYATNPTDAPDETLGSYRYTLTANIPLKYNIPVPTAGNYRVELFFARKHNDTFGANVRKFDIILENNTVKEDYDVYVKTQSGATSYWYVTAVNDGTLNISLTPLSGMYAHVNDIKVNGPVNTSAGSSSGRSRTESETTMADPEAENKSEGFSIFPNPASDHFDITFDKGGSYKLRIMNMLGQIPLSEELKISEGETRRFDISHLRDQQLYIIDIRSEKGIRKTFKLIKSEN